MVLMSTFASAVIRTGILLKTALSSRTHLLIILHQPLLIQRRVGHVLRIPMVSLPSLSMIKLGFGVRSANATTLLTPLKHTSRKVTLFLPFRHLLRSNHLLPLMLFKTIISPKLILIVPHLILPSVLFR